MNYFDYINSIEPNPNLKDNTKKRVQVEITKKNISIRKKRVAYLSTAACFAMFVTAVAITKSASNTPNIMQGDTTDNVVISTSENTQSINTTNSSDTQLQTTQNNAVVPTESTQAPTTKKPVDTNSLNDNIIKINVANDGNKYGAQKIKLGNKVFVQYCSSGDKANWGEDNGNIAINKSDIGDLICTVAPNNLIDFEHWDDYSGMSSSEANECKFNNAKIYEYKKCKNGTQLIVKTEADYYLFYLSDLTSKTSASEIFDMYSASGNNEVSKIKVFKCDASQDYVPYALCEIKDKNRIISVINTLKSIENNYSYLEIRSKGYIDDKFFDESFNIIFVFADGTELKAEIHKNIFGFCIVQKNDYGHHILSNSQYETLMKAITEG